MDWRHVPMQSWVPNHTMNKQINSINTWTTRLSVCLVDSGKRWVLEALNRYQLGFGKGVREAIDFELLGR